MRKREAVLITAALLVLAGCSDTRYTDPLDGYGEGAVLPVITWEPQATAEASKPAEVTSAPELPEWRETAIAEDAYSPRPSRRPAYAAYPGGESADITQARLTLEQERAGTIMVNVSGGSLAGMMHLANGSAWVYYTFGGRLYRRILANGEMSGWDITGAQQLGEKFATDFVTYGNAGMLCVTGDELLLLTQNGLNLERELMLQRKGMRALSRMDEMLYFIAPDGADESLYVMQRGIEPAALIKGVRQYQLDVLNRRIAALCADGIYMYSMDGDMLYAAVSGDVSAFCFAGDSIYYSCGSAIYALSGAGEVQLVAEAAAGWLGAGGGALYYTDGANALHRLRGGQDDVISPAAYNPTLLADRIVFGTQPRTGVGGESEY